MSVILSEMFSGCQTSTRKRLVSVFTEAYARVCGRNIGDIHFIQKNAYKKHLLKGEKLFSGQLPDYCHG